MPSYNLSDVPIPLPPEGEFEGPIQERFFALKGLCLTRWAEIEHSLSTLCRILLDTSDRNAAIVFYKSTGFESRCQLLGELVSSRLPADKAVWNILIEDGKKLSAFRNLLAHHTARGDHVLYTVFAESKDGVGSTNDPFVTFREWRVEVDERELVRGKREKTQAMSGDIRQHLSNLNAWEIRLQDFIKKAGAALPRRPLTP